jgi:hypothetical protein
VIAFLPIGLSVLLHGLTAAPLARRYARWFTEHPRPETLHVESETARDVRWRLAGIRRDAA